MPERKRYYWLQLQEGFFNQKEIKKLRKIAGGDTFTIIYLKMLIRSMNDDGKLYYEGYESDFPSELALDIDEDVDNVKVTVQYLISNGILIQCTESEYEILTAKEMIGSETDSARRMRRLRNTQTLRLTQNQTKASHCDADVTHSDADVTLSDADVRTCDIEKERDKDTDTDKDTDRKRNTKSSKQSFTVPTIEAITKYIRENGYNIDAQYFYDYYESNGWMVGKNKMKDWKATIRQWNRRSKDYSNRTKIHVRNYSGININDKPEALANETIL